MHSNICNRSKRQQNIIAGKRLKEKMLSLQSTHEHHNHHAHTVPGRIKSISI